MGKQRGGGQAVRSGKGEIEEPVKLTVGNELTEHFEGVLRTLFKRFDADKDGILSIKELNDFSKACNAGKDFSSDEIEEMRDYLDWDERADGLKEYGFLQMYHLQTTSEPAETWKVSGAVEAHRRACGLSV
jgi:Ca2+-binding EF-hand superfamily protein